MTASQSKNGFCPNSRYKSPTGALISRGGARFDHSKIRYSLDMPGPGNYEQKLNLNKTGNYTFYKWRNSGAPLFSKATRKVDLDTSATRKSNLRNILIILVTPGPGTYRVQTEFGFYNPTDNGVNQVASVANSIRQKLASKRAGTAHTNK